MKKSLKAEVVSMIGEKDFCLILTLFKLLEVFMTLGFLLVNSRICARVRWPRFSTGTYVCLSFVLMIEFKVNFSIRIFSATRTGGNLWRSYGSIYRIMLFRPLELGFSSKAKGCLGVIKLYMLSEYVLMSYGAQLVSEISIGIFYLVRGMSWSVEVP